jgi:hypothetical protein
MEGCRMPMIWKGFARTGAPMNSRTVVLITARAAGLAALLVGAGTSARAGELRASLEAGAAWQSRNDFRIPGDAGTPVDLAMYESGPFPAFRGTLTLDLTSHQSLRLLAAPLRVETALTPESPVSFQDLVFPPGQPLEATYVFNSYRLTWYWRFPPGEKWSFRLGATLKLRDAQIALAGASGYSAKDDLGLVPLLYLAARYQATERFALELEADALAAPQGRAEDVSLKGVIRLSDRVGLELGYRLLEGGADNDEVYTFAFFHYAFAGLRIRL